MTSQNAVIKCIAKAIGGLVGVALNTVSTKHHGNGRCRA